MPDSRPSVSILFERMTITQDRHGHKLQPTEGVKITLAREATSGEPSAAVGIVLPIKLAVSLGADIANFAAGTLDKPTFEIREL